MIKRETWSRQTSGDAGLEQGSAGSANSGITVSKMVSQVPRLEEITKGENGEG